MSYLDPPIEAQEPLLETVASFVLGYGQSVGTRPVAPPANAEDIRLRLADIDPEAPLDYTEAVEWCIELIGQTIIHPASPRYFGLFNPASTYMGIVGDLLTACFNPQLAAWSHAPGPVEIEAWLIRYFGERLGLGTKTRGSFTSGGAEANACALHLALTSAYPSFAEKGILGAGSHPAVYVSAEGHHSWLKIAHACGVGRAAVRHIPTKPDLTMDTGILARTIIADSRAGYEPVLIVATAGTTSAGAIDPLADLTEITRAVGAFLHVDAAWGGSCVLSEQLRPHLAGIEGADFVTIDAHKWLSAPMGAGMFLTRHGELLGETYRVSTEYMPASVEETVDPYTTSNQWSRRFTGLKLFLSLITAGRQGYASQLEHDVEMADYLRGLLRANRWRILNSSPLPVVCFVDDGRPDDEGHHQAIVDGVVGSGEAWISTTHLRGKPAIRACITSHRTRTEDIEHLVHSLDACRAERGGAADP